jgi:hypothetical protein
LPLARNSQTLLPGVRANDALPREEEDYNVPTESAQGKKSNAFSLMQPQEVARRLLPGPMFQTLQEFAKGVPSDCGPPWSTEVIAAARHTGPHVSALTEENIQLIWDDVEYQQQAGFVRVVTESILFGAGQNPALKISRVAVVPQTNRRGRIIVNLSAQVELPPEREKNQRRKRKRHHPSVNETTVPAADQTAVAALGSALPAILLFMFDTDCEWEIDWQKIDLSDGFWRIIVEDGQEFNFVYQLPRRPGDTETHYVVPSSLQMGWMNSPAYFCTATESARLLSKRMLALTFPTGIDVAHRHEHYCVPKPANSNEEVVSAESSGSIVAATKSSAATDAVAWKKPRDMALLSTVFVDDFMNGIAGPRGRKRKRQEQEWVARGTLHAIHAIFPPPDVLHHEGGRDSISEKKLKKGDATWKPNEVLLGFSTSDLSGTGRTVALPLDKKEKYADRIREALAQPRNFISMGQFQKIHGQLQHVAVAMPCMRGFMTPLNRALAAATTTVGLGAKSELRETLEAFLLMLDWAHDRPSHISEIVPPSLPHYYGYGDAAAVGAGGTLLPCTRWIRPIVWRVEWPEDIANEVRKESGTVSNSDVEAAAVFIAECILDDELGGETAGVSSHIGTDNKATEGWYGRKASRASHKAPERFLRWLAMRQRWTRRGPQDVGYYEGERNLLGDFPSRSYEKGFPRDADVAFLLEFSNRHPLPPQLGSWRLVHPRAEIVSAVCSLLRGKIDTTIHPATVTGRNGAGLPTMLASTLSSLDCKEPTSTWNEATCSWPLLAPCGTVNTTTADELRGRRSRRRFDGAPSAWSTEDLRTLGEQIRASTT